MYTTCLDDNHFPLPSHLPCTPVHPLNLLFKISYWVQLVLPISTWAHDPSLGVWQPTSSHTLKKIVFSFPSSHQLPITHLLRSRFLCTLSSSMMECWLARSCVDHVEIEHSCWKLMFLMAMQTQKSSFPSLTPHPLTVPFFCLLPILHSFLSLRWRKVDTDDPCETQHFVLFYTWYFDQSWVSEHKEASLVKV